MKKHEPSEFEKAAEESGGGFISELWAFLKSNKKWWMLPIIVFLLLLGLLVLLSGTGLAPFIYTMF
jgi:hypothetical protein